MFLARGLQTAASTRFYKSILKPVLGPYLEEELDVDQLDVQLSEGTIKLNSLNIKAAALNDALLASAGGGGSGSGRDGTGRRATSGIGGSGGLGRGGDDELPVPSVPFIVESCFVEELSLQFGSLSTIAEEGMDVEVDGITLDILPSSNFEEELRQIMKARSYRQQAEAAERKAAEYAAAAAAAEHAALCAAAAAEGLPMPDSPRKNASSTAASSTSTSTASFTSSFLSYFGLYDEEDVDEDDRGATGASGRATTAASTTSDAPTEDDDLARKGVETVRRLWDQITSNIRLSGTDIRLRFRLRARSGEALDDFLEINLPSLAYADETVLDEDVGITRQVVRFSEVSFVLVQGRGAHFDDFGSGPAKQSVDRGVETLLLKVGGEARPRKSDADPHRCCVTVLIPDAVHDSVSENNRAGGSGNVHTPSLRIDVFFSSVRAIIPDHNAVISTLTSLFLAYSEDPIVSPSTDVAANRRHLGDSAVAPSASSPSPELLGVSLTSSQVLQFASACTPKEDSSEEEADESDEDGFSGANDDFEDCVGPPPTVTNAKSSKSATLSEIRAKPERRKTSASDAESEIFLNVVCANFCVSVRGDFDRATTSAHAAQEIKEGDTRIQWENRHIRATANTLSMEISVVEVGPRKTVQLSGSMSGPKIESYTESTVSRIDPRAISGTVCHVELMTETSDSSNSSTPRGSDRYDASSIPSVVTMRYEMSETVPNGKLRVCFGGKDGKTTVRARAGLDTLTRWGGCFARLSNRYEHALAGDLTIDKLPGNSTSHQEPSSSNITVAVPGAVCVRIDVADDKTNLPGTPVFSSALLFKMKDAAVSIIPNYHQEKNGQCLPPSSCMHMYALPRDIPGVLLRANRMCISMDMVPAESKAKIKGARIADPTIWPIQLEGATIPIAPIAGGAERQQGSRNDLAMQPVWVHVFTSCPSRLVHPGIHPNDERFVHSQRGASEGAGSGAADHVGSGGKSSPRRLFRVDEEGSGEEGKRANKYEDASTSTSKMGSSNQTSGTSKSACIRAENALLQGSATAVVASVPQASVRLIEHEFADMLSVFSGFDSVLAKEAMLVAVHPSSDKEEASDDLDVDLDDLEDLIDDTMNHFSGLRGTTRNESEQNIAVEVGSAFALSIRSLTIDVFENNDNTSGAGASKDATPSASTGGRDPAQDPPASTGKKSTAKLRSYYRKILHLRKRQKVPFRFRIEASHFQLVQGSWTRWQCADATAAERLRRRQRANSRPREYRRVSCTDLLLMESDACCTHAKGGLMTPVLYSNKWGGPSKPAHLPAFGGLSHGCVFWFTMQATSNMRDHLKDVVLDIEFFGMTLRYDLYSSWVFRLIDLLFEPKSKLGGRGGGGDGDGGGSQTAQELTPQLNVLTQLQVTLHDSLVDYAPRQYIPLQSAGRMIFVVGELSLSTNIISDRDDDGSSCGGTESVLTIRMQDGTVLLAGRPVPYETKGEAVCAFFDDMQQESTRALGQRGHHNDHGVSILQSAHAHRLATWDIEQILIAAHFALVGRLDRMKFNVTTRPIQEITTNSKRMSPCFGEPDYRGSPSSDMEAKAPPPISEIEMDVGTVSLFCCADACAAILDMIASLSDEISLTNTFLESRAKVIPKRLVRRNVDLEDKDTSDSDAGELVDEYSSRREKERFLRGAYSHKTRSGVSEYALSKKGKKKTSKKTGILSSIDPHAFGPAAASWSSHTGGGRAGAGETKSSLPPTAGVSSPASAGKMPVIIEDFYTAGRAASDGPQEGRWLHNESPVLLSSGIDLFGSGFSELDDLETGDSIDGESFSLIQNRSGPASVVASAPPMFDDVAPSAPPMIASSISEHHPVVHAVLNAGAEMSSSDDAGVSSEQDESSTMYYSTLGFDGWWNNENHSPATGEGHTPDGDEDMLMSQNAFEMKTHVLHTQDAQGGAAEANEDVGSAHLLFSTKRLYPKATKKKKKTVAMAATAWQSLPPLLDSQTWHQR
jgi:hypothetical protein